MATIYWTDCPVCNVEVRAKADKTIWKHSPRSQSVARAHGAKDPVPPSICEGSGLVADKVHTADQ